MDQTVDASVGLAGLNAADWLSALDDIGEERGYFEPLGARHSAVFTDRSPVLLVTFETVGSIRARPTQLPLGFDLGDPHDWSQLCLIADGETWFRDKRVYGYFDRLVDDGFFEDFDRVIFWGAGACGYAAAAFSVVAPGATVIVAAPQATLDPTLAGWDRRHLAARRLDFVSRYGFAPAMIDAADRAFVFYDPRVTLDAVHAGYFTAPNVSLIAMPWFGDDPGGDLIRLGLLAPLLQAAAEGRLTPGLIHRALRARRDDPAYLRNLLGALQKQGKPLRLAKAARWMAERVDGPPFARVAARSARHLAKAAGTLPPRASPAPERNAASKPRMEARPPVRPL